MTVPDHDRAGRLVPRDPDTFSAFVAALVKGAKARRRGFPRRRPVTSTTPRQK